MRKNFYDYSDFPEFRVLWENWEQIRDEVQLLDFPQTKIHRVGKSHAEVVEEISDHIEQGGEFGWVNGWGIDGVNEQWLQLILLENDCPLVHLEDKMSGTISLLSQLRGIKVAAIVRLKPNSFLPPHTHASFASEGILQMHITLEAAFEENYAYLNVAGDFRQHVPGCPIIFDGSLSHFVINLSSKVRTILYVEFLPEFLQSKKLK